MFGQCWDGEGSERSAFALKSGVEGLTDDQFVAMENTIDFLNRYHLNWRDYMTQCILSHIFSGTHQINENRLELFYNDCLNKDELLDELAATQEDQINRRQLELSDQNKSKNRNSFRFKNKNIFLDFYYKDPYVPLIKSDNIIVSLETSHGVPIVMEYDRPDELDISLKALALAQAAAEQEELEQSNRYNAYYIADDEVVLEDRPKLISEESIMRNQKKIFFCSIPMKFFSF